MTEKKHHEEISAADLATILEVNHKAIEINLEVEKQNEQVLNILDGVKEAMGKMQDKIEEIDRSLFRLMVILSSAGAGTIFTILQTFLHH